MSQDSIILPKNVKNLTGKKFGKLTCISYSHTENLPSKLVHSFWKCVCDCGKECIKSNFYMKRGDIKDCGCVKKDKILKNRINKFHKSYLVKENGCWEWTEKKDDKNYGCTSFRKNGKKSRISAHRFSYEIHKGEIPKGMFVCHNCPGGDNPSCVNPNHLWIGNHTENMRDKGYKGTQCKGETHGNHKLNEKDVKNIKIKHFEGKSYTILAIEYKVSRSTIAQIIKGRSWRHVSIPHNPEVE